MFSICLFISFLGVGANARAVPCTRRCTTRSQIDTDGSVFVYRNASTSALPVRTDLACHIRPTTTSPSAISEEAILTIPSDQYLAATSTDDSGPAKLQSASYLAQPSSDLTTLATSISGVPAEPQSDYSVSGGLPSAPVPVLRSEGSANVTASLLSSRLAAGTSEHPPAATLAITHSTFRLGHFVVANQTVSEPTRIPLSATSKAMSDPQTTEEPQNALSVLLSALPSDLASSIEAGYSIVTHNLLATSDTETSRPTSRPTPTDRSREPILSTSRSEPRPTSNTQRPTDQSRTSRPTSHPTIPRTSSHTARPTSHPPPRPSSKPTPSPSSTFTTSTRPTSTTSSTTSNPPPPTSTTTPTEAETNTQPSITPERQQANGTIAGVATGAAAGVVLITLAIFFFLRRRQRKRALQAVVAKSDQPYPEVAWLYDPVRSPPRSVSPAPQPGANGELGMTQMQAQRSSLLAPEVVMPPEGEPLLAPGRAATRDNSPSGGVRSASPSGR